MKPIGKSLAGAAAIAIAGMFGSAPAGAAETINFVLNWVPGGDHAPVYWAREQGWYEDAGIDLVIEDGTGSGASAKKVGVGRNQLGIADLPTMLQAKGNGADLVAVMNIYANSPYGMYWLKSSGIEGIEDFPGRSIGNPPSDAARAMWPALAQSAGIEPDSVRWVNVQPNAKLAGVKAGSIDITTSFYNIHHIFERELGDDMGYFAWKEHGINPYGNSLFVNGDFLAENPEAVAAFAEVTQRAFAFCVETPEPCIDALVTANTGLMKENELQNWGLVVELMTDETSTMRGLGFFDEGRMQMDYELVETYFDVTEPFDVTEVYTNEYLDESIKMPATE